MEILFEKGIPGFESYNYFNVSAIEGNERFYNIAVRTPGVAKLGIALGSGPRGRGFKSRHSDQTMIIRTTLSKWVMCSDLSFLLKM